MANSKIFAPLDYLQGDNISGQTDFLEDLDYISLPIPANQYYDLEKGFELTHLVVAYGFSPGTEPGVSGLVD